MLACWPLRDRLTCGYFNIVSNIVNKKMDKKQLFLAALFHSEIRTLAPIISLRRAEFLDLAGIEVLIRIAYIALRIACVECCLPYGDSTSKMCWRICR
jgi:hypothetical protein